MAKLKFGVLYCFWNNVNSIKETEIIEARNISSAFRKTDRNLETNIVIPINKNNIKQLTKLINNMKSSSFKRK